jgi:rhodanese-related sulfurtransferase
VFEPGQAAAGAAPGNRYDRSAKETRMMSNAPDAATIGHDELVDGLNSGGLALVDVREPDEYAAGHIPGAVSLPMSRFDAAELPADKPVVLVCQSGRRSALMLAKAKAAGRAGLRHYAPGTKGWREGGGPLER